MTKILKKDNQYAGMAVGEKDYMMTAGGSANLRSYYYVN